MWLDQRPQYWPTEDNNDDLLGITIYHHFCKVIEGTHSSFYFSYSGKAFGMPPNISMNQWKSKMSYSGESPRYILGQLSTSDHISPCSPTRTNIYTSASQHQQSYNTHNLALNSWEAAPWTLFGILVPGSGPVVVMVVVGLMVGLFYYKFSGTSGRWNRVNLHTLCLTKTWVPCVWIVNGTEANQEASHTIATGSSILHKGNRRATGAISLPIIVCWQQESYILE